MGELEAGRANISVMNLVEVARALDVPLPRLLEGAEPEPGVVALLGLRGAGKSSVGKQLAAQLGVAFFELDKLVEPEAGMRLSEIFAIHGEGYFRQAELAALRRFLETHERGVLATGGGLVESPQALALLKSRARTVWLKASPDEHWSRVVEQGDLRPMKNRPQAMPGAEAPAERARAALRPGPAARGHLGAHGGGGGERASRPRPQLISIF